MPIYFIADSKARMLHVTASGFLTYDDFAGHIQAKEAEQVMGYAELFDVRGATLDLSIADLYRLREDMRRAMKNTMPARLAVVTDSAFIAGLARAYQAITQNDNPHFEVFTDFAKARAWVMRKKVGRLALR